MFSTIGPSCVFTSFPEDTSYVCSTFSFCIQRSTKVSLDLCFNMLYGLKYHHKSDIFLQLKVRRITAWGNESLCICSPEYIWCTHYLRESIIWNDHKLLLWEMAWLRICWGICFRFVQCVDPSDSFPTFSPLCTVYYSMTLLISSFWIKGAYFLRPFKDIFKCILNDTKKVPYNEIKLQMLYDNGGHFVSVSVC